LRHEFRRGGQELLAFYDEKVKSIAEERRKDEEEALKALEEGQDLPALSGAPKPALPRIPDLGGDAEGFPEDVLGAEGE
jgi:hypothetical protein